MSVVITLDPGSTHMGKLSYAKELVRIAGNEGADCIKFQLFDVNHPGVKRGNIPIPLEWWPELDHEARGVNIDLAASFFDKRTYEFAFSKNLPYMKFAYSMQHETDWIRACLTVGKKVIVSTDWMNHRKLPEGVKKYYCHTRYNSCSCCWEPQYPVMEKINFDPLFPPFDGFSDHTLGWKETEEAVLMGAQYIEKHFTLGYGDITCPDALFALTPKQVGRMIFSIRKIQL